MKALATIAAIGLLASACDTGSIKQLKCTSKFDETAGGAFVFDTQTGAAHEYSDFYEKLENIEGITTSEGITYDTQSALVDGKWKHRMLMTEQGEEPTEYELEVDLGSLQFKERSVYGNTPGVATGTCEWVEPKTTEVHERLE